MNLVFMCSPEGDLLYISSAVKEMFGYMPSELLGRLLSHRLIETYEVQKIMEAMRGAIRCPQEIEHILIHQIGRRSRVRTTFHSVGGNSPLPPGMVIGVSELMDEVETLDHLLTLLAASVNMDNSEDFFRRFIMHITSALRVDYAFVTMTDETRENVTMLSFWKGDHFAEGKSYPLQDTPCDAVIKEGKICYYPLAVRGKFPHDQDLVDLSAQGYLGVPIFGADGLTVGHLAILDQRPLRIPDRYTAVLRLFAFRASPLIEAMRGKQTTAASK